MAGAVTITARQTPDASARAAGRALPLRWVPGTQPRAGFGPGGAACPGQGPPFLPPSQSSVLPPAKCAPCTALLLTDGREARRLLLPGSVGQHGPPRTPSCAPQWGQRETLRGGRALNRALPSLPSPPTSAQSPPTRKPGSGGGATLPGARAAWVPLGPPAPPRWACWVAPAASAELNLCGRQPAPAAGRRTALGRDRDAKCEKSG